MKLTLKKFFTHHWPYILILSLYIGSHVFNLTALPIFADESIYIRWSQLLIDDWQQYSFFALNDGKTPLFIWLVSIFQFVGDDHLWSARFASVLVGFFQVLAVGYFTKLLGGRRVAQLLAMVFTTVLPFWFFHHRMAMMDGLLTLFLTITMIGVIKICLVPVDIQTSRELLSKKLLRYLIQRSTVVAILWTGVGLGLALWTKLPALLILPVLLLWLWWQSSSYVAKTARILSIGLGVGLGLFLFSLLLLSPVFGQLFNRGSDFLYPVGEVLEGKWQQTLANIPTYLAYFGVYLGWGVLSLAIVGLFTKKLQRTHHLLLWSAVLFAAPIIVLGRVVYPRYLFPAALFITTSAALALSTIITNFIPSRKKLYSTIFYSFIVALFAAQLLQFATIFAVTSWFAPNAVPFVPADKTQYLTEWSSGHGIVEAVQLIDRLAADHTVAVATEGFFGTLPDAILAYQYGKNLENVYVEGVGQPVNSLTQKFYSRAQNFDQVILIVNSHRLQLTLPPSQLLASYCRPYNAPCLQVWDITPQLQNNSLHIRAD